VHLDLFSAHKIEDAPGGASPAAESGHEDIGVEDGVCSSDDEKSGLRSFSSYVNHIKHHRGVSFAASDFVTPEKRRQSGGALIQRSAPQRLA
jgi:hypothetical protein